jgi:hypothetical protein
VDALQPYGAQLVPTLFVHAPKPLHAKVSSDEPLHPGEPHTVPRT